MTTNNEIFIPGNVRSSKNSKRILKNQRTKDYFIGNSEQAQEYKNSTSTFWIYRAEKFHDLTCGLPKPLLVKFTFVRENKSRFDFVNLLQLPLDLMVKYGWIIDDNYNEICPIINPVVLYDAAAPGLIIEPIKEMSQITSLYKLYNFKK